MSYAEYLAFEREAEAKHEYVNGEVYAMAGGSPEHARLAIRLAAELLRSLADRPCEVFSSDLRVRNLVTGRSTYPDLTVVCGRLLRAPDDELAVVNPVLVVEVLSDGTERQDRGDKWRHYQLIESLQTYVLVSQAAPLLEVFRRADDAWRYQAAGPGQQLTLDDRGLTLDVDALYRSGLPG
ncbi:Uma2 family endonuclease [Enhygromyxa salina]|nr:Uma2 family endonuclease [Enhygromyxa salina]